MSDNRYSYLKPKQKEEKKPVKKKVNVMGIVVTVFAVISLVILILSIVGEGSGNSIFASAIVTALLIGWAVIAFVCGEN